MFSICGPGHLFFFFPQRNLLEVWIQVEGWIHAGYCSTHSFMGVFKRLGTISPTYVPVAFVGKILFHYRDVIKSITLKLVS